MIFILKKYVHIPTQNAKCYKTNNLAPMDYRYTTDVVVNQSPDHAQIFRMSLWGYPISLRNS